MKKSIFIALFLFFICSSYSKEVSINFRIFADFWSLPYYYESQNKLYGTSLNGAIMGGVKLNNMTFGTEITENYFSLNETDFKTGHKGAWNILRGSLDYYIAPISWLELKAGIGASWIASAFSENSIGTIGRHEPGLSFLFDIRYKTPWKYMDVKLINLMDIFFTESYIHPSYYGAVRVIFHPYYNFLDIYMETGVLVWIYEGQPVEVKTAMFTWSVGISLDMVPGKGFSTQYERIIKFKGPTKTAVIEEKKNEISEIEKFKAAQKGEKVEFNNIIFLPNTSSIKEESFSVLSQIANILIERKEINIEIYGHTNDIGKPDKEYNLSVKRSEKVKEFLVNKGVDPKRITCFGYGSVFNKKLPVDEVNRKVEIKISEIDNF